jgi:hypothetical protein
VSLVRSFLLSLHIPLPFSFPNKCEQATRKKAEHKEAMHFLTERKEKSQHKPFNGPWNIKPGLIEGPLRSIQKY